MADMWLGNYLWLVIAHSQKTSGTSDCLCERGIKFSDIFSARKLMILGVLIGSVHQSDLPGGYIFCIGYLKSTMVF